ncbi:hypothetical protein [Streptomyces iranensis]|uniref:Uncharacterized protein n=1 Tax=Streptomyces iranensis TaxID=576784 RepID=A0ABS4MRR8_9ACTN|nr:hypothetical protein [Streptomyces iranensis]MBP2062421.1 hypothetical protein [Streptomyces iranensis]
MTGRPADKPPTLADILTVIREVRRDQAAARRTPGRPVVRAGH